MGCDTLRNRNRLITFARPNGHHPEGSDFDDLKVDAGADTMIGQILKHRGILVTHLLDDDPITFRDPGEIALGP